MKSAYLILIYFLSAIAMNSAQAGSREEAVIAECTAAGATGAGYAYCVAAGLTQNEVQTCMTTPSECFGPNNTLRQLFCGIGVGCPSKPYVNNLQRVFPYQDGCIAVFRSGTYFSPDCENLSGGGKTENVWPGHGQDLIDLIVLNDCIITAFSGGGIYRSCDGRNLGGGGKTTRVYQGRPVQSMRLDTDSHSLITIFNDNSCYRDPSGIRPGGGLGVERC